MGPIFTISATTPLQRSLPRAFITVLALALTLFVFGQFPNPAIGATKAAQADKGKQALMMLDKGELAASAGRFEDAASCWRRALEIKPGWTKAQARLAEIPIRQKRFPAKKAARERGSRARLAYVDGVGKFNAGDYRRAVELFAACLDVYPQDQLAAKHLALSNAMLRDMAQGSLKVVCQPSAKVYLDGEQRGSTPITLNSITIGKHKVAVEEYGARAVKVVEIKPRTLSCVAFILTGGRLEVTCEPKAEIWLDGRHLGQSPLSMIGLPVGNHRLQACCSGYCEEIMKVRLEKGTASKLNLKLSPIAKER
jgi:tetratricopeptide (TPR) repeat protein